MPRWTSLSLRRWKRSLLWKRLVAIRKSNLNITVFTSLQLNFVVVLQIVAEILKHAKSNNISSVTKLRSVCKLWRKLCFPLLNQSARKFDLHEEWTQLDYFLKTFSSDCSLPLRLDVTSSTWKLRELLFLSTYAANITSVVFKNVPKFAFGFLEVPQSTVILPRLKSLTVIVPRGHFYFPEESDEYQMLETIIGNAKNLNRFRVSLNLDSYHGNEVIPGETLSSKVTSLQITVETNLTILKNWMPHAYLPKLQNLEVYSREIENTAECNEVLSNLYNTFRTSLEEIVCKHSDKNHVMQLRLQKMDKLKCLQVCNSDFVPEKLGCQIPDILPNLVYISISHYGHQLAYYLGKVMEDNCSLGNIQSLKLHTSQSPRNLTDFTDTMVKVIKVTPTLRSLTCNCFTPGWFSYSFQSYFQN